jgi:hypothetical protein
MRAQRWRCDGLRFSRSAAQCPAAIDSTAEEEGHDRAFTMPTAVPSQRRK